MLYERALEIWDRVAPAAGELPLERLEVVQRAAEAALTTGEEERAIALGREVLAGSTSVTIRFRRRWLTNASAATCGVPDATRTRCPRTGAPSS